MRPASLLLGTALAVMVCSTASARIGETLEQCVARYGAPDSGPKPAEGGLSASTYYFVKSGRDIQITFYDGKAVELLVHRRDGKVFSDSEVETMLSENKSLGWVENSSPSPHHRIWTTSDAKRQAFLSLNYNDMPNAIFAVFTVEWRERAYPGNKGFGDALKRTLDGAESAIRGLRDLLGY